MRWALLAVALVALGSPTWAQAPDPHAGHAGHGQPAADPVRSPGASPRGHTESAPPPTDVLLPPWVPEITDQMRQAAFPDVHGHASHDRRINSLVLFDRLEWSPGADAATAAWNATGWVGGDLHRLWFRSSGEAGDQDHASVHALYGRAFTRWWDIVGGVRQDLQPGARTWLALGVQGLAPGFFEVQATAYIAGARRAAAQVEVEYDLLVTNRVVVQPVAALELNGGSDATRDGEDATTGELGVRVRYQVRREFAPYVGLTWQRAFGSRGSDGHAEPTSSPRVVIGARVWF